MSETDRYVNSSELALNSQRFIADSYIKKDIKEI